jgi:hypothetical protein
MFAILLVNVCCSTAVLANPPARRAAPFAKEALGGSAPELWICLVFYSYINCLWCRVNRSGTQPLFVQDSPVYAEEAEL